MGPGQLATTARATRKADVRSLPWRGLTSEETRQAFFNDCRDTLAGVLALESLGLGLSFDYHRVFYTPPRAAT